MVGAHGAAYTVGHDMGALVARFQVHNAADVGRTGRAQERQAFQVALGQRSPVEHDGREQGRVRALHVGSEGALLDLTQARRAQEDLHRRAMLARPMLAVQADAGRERMLPVQGPVLGQGVQARRRPGMQNVRREAELPAARRSPPVGCRWRRAHTPTFSTSSMATRCTTTGASDASWSASIVDDDDDLWWWWWRVPYSATGVHTLY